MFDKLNAVRKHLYNKDNLSLKEKYLYELNSLCISLIHDNKLLVKQSKITCNLYKSIIEIITLISYIDNNKEIEEEINLYNKSKELEIYKKYSDKIKLPFYHFKDIELCETKNIELDILNFDYDLDDLIIKYHNELYKYYIDLKDDKIDDLSLDVIILTMVYMINIKSYPDIKASYKDTLEYEESFFVNHPLSQRYLTYVRSECMLLNNVINKREEFKKLSFMLLSFTSDKLFLNSEVFEIKFIIIVEYLNKLLNEILNENLNIYDFIDEVLEDDLSRNYIKLIYNESKLLNHRCGYMVISYIDVYEEYSEAIRFIDLAIGLLLKHIGDADMYNDFINIIDSKNTFDYENQYLVDKKEE